MTKKSSQLESFDRVITALEEIVIAAPDDEVLASFGDYQAAADEVRALIGVQIANWKESSNVKSISVVKTSSKKYSRRGLTQSNKPASRLALLRNLAMTRPDLAPRAATIFGGLSKPTRSELDELERELVLLGLLSENEQKK